MRRHAGTAAGRGRLPPLLSWPWLVAPGEVIVLAAAVALSWITDVHPLLVPFWGPWDFSWAAFLGIGFTVLWFLRGLRAASEAQRPATWRIACFLAGQASIYAVLLTHFEYLAQHMFFLNRAQHAVLHHFGPFLIALSWPSETITRGMPPVLYRCCSSAPVRTALRKLQQPLLAAALFEGLLILWLIPPVTYRAMYNVPLYNAMNASMLIDGLLFWFLVLDPRPMPAAQIGFFPRLALAFLIIFPQIGIGTALGLAQHDLYPSFTECGRVFSEVGPLLDQQIGGLVVWIPTGMMSAVASLLIMRRLFMHEDGLSRASGLARSEGVV